MEYLKGLETLLGVVLGWLFGLLTPSIAERIRRPYRRRDLVNAVIEEMLAIQFTMAAVAYRVRMRNSNVTDAFLDEILPILTAYQGPDRDEGFFESIKRSRELYEEHRAAMHKSMRMPNHAVGMKQYGMPLLASQMVDLAICSSGFQRSVLHIRHHLDLYNQIGVYAQSQFDKTFAQPNPNDRLALIANQEEAYRDAGRRAEIIMRAISDLKKQYGGDR